MKDHSTSSLEIHLLGHFRVLIDGKPVNDLWWKRRKAKLLVKLLAVQPDHELHRDKVLEYLWPELDPGAAAKNLYRAIHVARRALESRIRSGKSSKFIQIREQQVYLRAPGGLVIDVEKFERKATEALRGSDTEKYEIALALYRGDLLTDDPYEDWLEARRRELRSLQRDLVVNLAGFYEKTGQHRPAIDRLKLIVQQEPSDEEAHRLLMKHYALAGDKLRALEQYRHCKEVLRQEFNLEPELATAQLERQILSGRLRPAPAGEPFKGKPSYRQLTYRRGSVRSARILPGSQLVVFAAAWDGGPVKLYQTALDNQELKSFGPAHASVLAVSRAGEVAVSLDPRLLREGIYAGTLALMDLDGGRLRKVLEEVQWADWSPDGKMIAVVRSVGERNRLEYPIGHLLYETSGWISHPRVSPGGNCLALIEYPAKGDDRAAIVVINLAGEKQTLSSGWTSAYGLAWAPSGDRIIFTATEQGNSRGIYAISLDGQSHWLEHTLGDLTIHDTVSDRQALVTHHIARTELIALPPDHGLQTERNLSWHKQPLLIDLTANGRTVLFTGREYGAGPSYRSYLRATDGARAVNLGEGSALGLSPDGRWVLLDPHTWPTRLVLLAAETEGQPRQEFDSAGVQLQQPACWFGDGARLVCAGREPGKGSKLYALDVRGKVLRALRPETEGIEIPSPHLLSPDEHHLAVLMSDRKIHLFPLAGGEPRLVSGDTETDVPLRWSADGGALYVRQRGSVPASICRLDIMTGVKSPWIKLQPCEPTGVTQIQKALLTPDGKNYAYSYLRDLSDIYLISELS